MTLRPTVNSPGVHVGLGGATQKVGFSMNKHTFAFYKKNLLELVGDLGNSDELSFKDPELWNRLTKIVRIKPKDLLILFDENINIKIKASEEIVKNKRIISGTILEKDENKTISPRITLYLPVLKKDALEYAIYVSAQMGVQDVILVESEKSQKKFNLEKEYDRLKKIMISACEQSKNFVFPELQGPICLENISEQDGQKIFFDQDGQNILKLIEPVKKYDRLEKIIITIGPEAGYTPEEKDLLKRSGFSSYKLTPTILRSREAVCVGLGIVRSFFVPPKQA